MRTCERVFQITVVVAACAALGIEPARADAPRRPLVANGSFELGQDAPEGWTLAGQGTWTVGDARDGNRFLRAVSASGEGGWQSASIALVPGTDCRLEGWVRSEQGTSRLVLDQLDADGRVVRSVEAPRVGNVPTWRYVAVDFKAEAPRATMRFAADGAADLDDVSLVPSAIPYLGNRDLQSDARGRIGFWGEEKEAAIAPGNRGGSHRGDPAVKRREVPALAVETSGDWYAVSSVNYPLLGFTEQVRLSGWARGEGEASAQILACWMDNAQKILRVDASPAVRGASWQRITLVPPAAPEGAYTVRLVALARGGKAWFDEFDLLHLSSTQPRVRVFANQVGYELAGPKSAVVATNFFPPDGSTLKVQLHRADGAPPPAKEVACQGRIHSGKPDDWGWYFWRYDFSELREPGTYRVTVAGDTARGESFPFVVERGAILNHTAASAVDFFFVQRCGFDVPGWHRACHLDDAKAPDGTHTDVSGGWHSAGDYNKPMWQFGDSGACYALVTAASERPESFARFDRDRQAPCDALDEAHWGAKFLAKMQNPSDGSMRGDVLQGPARTWMRWEAPDVHTDNQIGTPDDPVIAPAPGNTPLAVAAWAALARALDARGVEHDYTGRAERLWEVLSTAESAAGNPLLLVGALELHLTCGDDKYRQFADRAALALLKSQKATGALAGDTGDHGDVAAAALALYALHDAELPLRPAITGALTRYLDFCVARADNPFGLSRQGVEDPQAVFFHPAVGMGVNFWLLSRAWSALLVHRVTRDPRALVYAADQIDWVLGKNPLALCMFEGHGGRNPPRYHHRYNMIAGRERGAVPGAIPNGIVRDMGIADRSGFDMSRAGGRSPSFRTSEPWLVHNMFYLLAASSLEKNLEGDGPEPK